MTTNWEACSVSERTNQGGHSWGVRDGSLGEWIAFGTEACCRRMVEHLAAADAILLRHEESTQAAGRGMTTFAAMLVAGLSTEQMSRLADVRVRIQQGAYRAGGLDCLP